MIKWVKLTHPNYLTKTHSIKLLDSSQLHGYNYIYVTDCGFCLERFPLPLGAWDGLHYFIVALPESSIYLFC